MQSQTQEIFRTSQEARESRRRRVAEVLSECICTLPSHVSQLDLLLSVPPIDLTRVTRIISRDSEFSGLLLSLASTEFFNTRSCGVTISQAVVLFGSERLRTLALACAFIKYAGRELSHSDRERLWQHSFLTAALSQRTARQVSYPEAGQAYVAGLLHEIGRLPLLAVARQERLTDSALRADWQESPSAEREYFGVDHCEIGRLIATEWNLAPSLIDAIEHYPSSSHAKHDSDLAEIVAVGDRYANLLSPAFNEDCADTAPPKASAVDVLLRMCVPRLPEDESAGVIDFSKEEQFGAELMARPLN